MKEKRKVLIGYIVNGRAGGVDKYILNFISLFSDKYEIDVLTNHLDYELRKQLNDEEIGLIEVANLKHPLKQYKNLINVFSKKQYDICYAAVSTALSFLLMYTAKKVNVPARIVHCHASDVDGKKKSEIYLKRMMHWICKPMINRSSNRYFACSGAAADWMFTKKRRKEVQIIPNCIKFEDYYFDRDVRARYRKEYKVEDKIVLGHVSNFLPPKNPMFLIEILKKMKSEGVPIILALVGEGRDKEIFLHKIKELGLENEILDLGFQKDVTPFYQMMDFLVLPSNFESFSYVTLEAEVSGLYCLISDRIPDDAVVSLKCKKLPIDEGADSWCDTIIKNIGYDREKNSLIERAQTFNESMQRETIFNILEEK